MHLVLSGVGQRRGGSPRRVWREPLEGEAAEGEVGTIDEVYDAPAGPMLSVRRERGKELLIPFVRQMIRRVDPAEKVLELDLPAGLLDL